MIPLRAITIGLFLLLLAGCGEDSATDAPVLPYPGTYEAMVLYNQGDTLDLVLDLPDQYTKTFYAPERRNFAAEGSGLYHDYHADTREGVLQTIGKSSFSMTYTYTFDGQTMTGQMRLVYSYERPYVDIDTTVTMVRR